MSWISLGLSACHGLAAFCGHRRGLSPAAANPCNPALMSAAAIVLVGIVGCGSGMPKTYPVKGKVVFKGGKPVTDGRIQFQRPADAQIKALGDIDQDGSFSLTTYVGAKKVPGAPVGPYSVVVELERPTKVVALPSTFTVEPRENDFTIAIERPRR
jgi:hypothetical protein